MADLPPFGPGRAPRNPTYDFALPRVAIPLWSCAAGTSENSRASWPSRLYWGSYWNLVLLCCWLHPTQWPNHAAWTALRILAMCQCKPQALAASNTGLWQEHMYRARCGWRWCSAGMAHTKSTRNLIYVACYAPMCIYESI